jgi:glycosyltransferase involved in cell wall biosynthesis
MIDSSGNYQGRLGIQQRVLPAYRSGFFDALAAVCGGGLSVFAGEVHTEESIPTSEQLQVAKLVNAHNRHFLNAQSPYYFLWQGGLVNWLEEWKPDVLVIEANPRYLSTGKAIRWMHERHKPVIGWGLGAPPIGKQTSSLGNLSARWRNHTRKNLLRQLDALIAYSHKGASEYLAITSPDQKVYVASNAVARRPEGESPERSPDFGGRPKVLYVGRLQARKRIDILLRACASLPSKLQPLLWIVGDGPERGELENLAATIYPTAEFPGQKHGPELEQYFKEADLFVLPGTGGLAVQEAMTFGLPVVVAEGDGTQDDLVRSGNGWLIPANNEQVLRSTLEEALLNPLRLRKMGEASFKIVREEINIEQMVRVFVRALNSLSESSEINQ